MTFDEYQEQAHKTLNTELLSCSRKSMLLFGIAGEVGELLNKIKKVRYHHHEVPAADIYEEFGDVLWYLAELCNEYGTSLDSVARNNILKLSLRYPEGFSSERSINREDD